MTLLRFSVTCNKHIKIRKISPNLPKFPLWSRHCGRIFWKYSNFVVISIPKLAHVHFLRRPLEKWSRSELISFARYHDYLNYNSHHPLHVKQNIPYVLTKRIIVFTSEDKWIEENLKDLNRWLLACGYPQQIIGIHNAKLQGPAPKPKSEINIPLISTSYSNYCDDTIVNVAENLLKNSNNERLKNAFKDVKFINALRQPPNLLRELRHSAFIQRNKTTLSGCFKWKDKRCKICKLYLQECKSFETAGGYIWEIRGYIDCNSINVLYYLTCNFCKKTTYTGKDR